MKFITFVIFMISLTPVLAFAGAESHGGGVFVCRDSNMQIKKEPLAIELIDLWEAVHTNKHLITRSDSSVDEQIARAMKRLKTWYPNLYDSSDIYVAMSVENLRTLPPLDSEAVIGPPRDLGPSIVKRGCPAEGLASYSDYNDYLQINQEILNAVDLNGKKIMSNTDLAAFHVHEGVCRGFRAMVESSGDSDLDTAKCRKIVGFLFADEPVPDFTQENSHNGWDCHTESYSYRFQVGGNNLEAGKIGFSFSIIDWNPLQSAFTVLEDAKNFVDFFDKTHETTFFIKTGVTVFKPNDKSAVNVPVWGLYDNYNVALSLDDKNHSQKVFCSPP